LKLEGEKGKLLDGQKKFSKQNEKSCKQKLTKTTGVVKKQLVLEQRKQEEELEKKKEKGSICYW